MRICPLDESDIQLSWIMWYTIDIHYWAFGGTSISWNTTLFPFIIINIAVFLKLHVNFKLKWLSFVEHKHITRCRHWGYDIF